ncbi:hypothetical protein ACFRFH_18415 [Leifsonia sp. NPDC056824]|uniref:hypothetical protein n=1 Tax=Leifsonia sp. NPDC056824 TaxID=3345953 RepID=UPI00368CBADA
MADTGDPLFAQIRRHFDAVLSSDESAREAAEWSHEQLDHQTWTDEVAFQGLMRLADLVGVNWNYVSESADAHGYLFRSYWDWMEVVRWYEDDPAAWKANYFRGLVTSFTDRFGTDRAATAVAALVESGEITSEEAARWSA